jgi:GNAT superfamily N-acetyltransferase
MDVLVNQSGSFAAGQMCFYIKEGVYLSLAEMSNIDGNVWWFERLSVHPKSRGKGYGSLLVDKVVEFCKSHMIKLECGLNPYGVLTFEQLRDFYIRHGFTETGEEGLMVLDFQHNMHNVKP